MDMQCRLVTPTPIQYLGTGPGGQRIYIKRDDLLGFSFGGNKCRIAEVLLQDMKEKLVNDDREGLEEMFRLSTKRREAFDKK